MARGLGTILGVLVLSVILLFSIPTPVAVILMGIAALFTEALVGARLCDCGSLYYNTSYFNEWISITEFNN